MLFPDANRLVHHRISAACAAACPHRLQRRLRYANSINNAQALVWLLGGSVHGGQQPVTSAHVYLFAAGTTGYGSAPSSLLNTSTAGVSSDASGNALVPTDASGDWMISATTPVPLRAVSSISSRSADVRELDVQAPTTQLLR